jgi:hypothetical protein
LDDNGNPVAQRKKADFRGTVSFASLNAHNNIVSIFEVLIGNRIFLEETIFGVYTLLY